MAEKVDSKRAERQEDEGIQQNEKPFDHPVYKKLALLNGEINKMSKNEIQKRLAELRMDTRGVKEVLKKRLKNYYKKQKLMRANVRPSPKEASYDYFLVIDFEATCDEHNFNYNHEIIEFPIVLVDGKDRIVVDEFHSYVKPVTNPKLTPFCTQLTGITQRQVEAADEFPCVLEKVHHWLEQHELGTSHSFAVVTDGPWDMGRFMYNQCKLLNIAFPPWAKKWCNIRKAYGNFYRCRKAKLAEMLHSLGMQFEGNEHSGIDDSRNIARILIHLLQDGASMRMNERIYDNKLKKLTVLGVEEPPIETISTDSDGENETEAEQNQAEDCGFGHSNNGAGQEDNIEHSLANLSLTSGGQVSSENDDVDDLLAYYSLQKS